MLEACCGAGRRWLQREACEVRLPWWGGRAAGCCGDSSPNGGPLLAPSTGAAACFEHTRDKSHILCPVGIPSIRCYRMLPLVLDRCA